ncbi:MAG: sigma 54-interacting transcriptional regulator, partial [Acidobacteria bacterium]|nr:sigma 54-interacting transcriptional regulator [Acidobacteriota bacterium]
MSTRFPKGSAEPVSDRTARPTSGVVNISDARRAGAGRVGAASSSEELYKELEETRELLDRGLPSAAETRLRQLINNARRDPRLLALARRILSMTLEVKGRYDESLAVVQMYEAPDARGQLDAETFSALRVQVGLAYTYTGDHPKAIALLNAELREHSEEGSDTQLGVIYAALAQVYRRINESSIARDYVNKALGYFRRTGDWRGLAESYSGLALTDTQEGQYEDSLANFEQAIQLIGERTAPYLLGKIYNNLAGAYWFLKRPHDGIRSLEKGVKYYESTEHKDNASIGYNNLGINLMLVGEWERAHTALKRALDLSLQIDEHGRHASMIYDSLGELHMLRGELEEAREYLERAVRIATEIGKKWYAAQAMRTLTRCYLATNQTDSALVTGEGALALAERIGDRQAICESSLLLAEAHLQNGNAKQCSKLLHEVSEETADSATDLAIAGDAQRVYGMLALEQKDAPLAAHHFGRSNSIFEMLGDRYRSARAHYWLGRANAIAQPARAVEHLGLAAHTFRELGARLDLERAEEFLASLETKSPEHYVEPPAPAQLLTLRLAEAVASRELLLRELAAVIHQETSASRVLIAETGDEGHFKVVVAHGCTNAECTRFAAALDNVKTDEDRERFALEQDARVFVLRSANSSPAVLVVSPLEQNMLAGGAPLEPLLRVVELGMDVCALRSRARTGRDAPAQDSLAGASLMPGFIHSSPAMTRLVDEVHKIRSSDVTVLVTGESGTGKELVARAIHAISSRRTKVFVPFNCTAVPKELSEGYLFGYRRGAFTGAVSDSPGVIRTAAGGTLFLDEVGDLPLDVQPKLLRFLQEGEIQPLGEQRPAKVDVRIIAATNTDLERMVEDGRFREDLYYRLNV